MALTIVFLGVVLSLATFLFERSNQYSQVTSRRVGESAALVLAESGLEKAIWCLNNPADLTNCPNNPNFTGESDVALTNGTFSTQVSGFSNTRTVDAYGTATTSMGPVTKHLQVLLTTNNTNASFQYGVQAGEGGIVLDNNATINGNAYTNGSITGGNNSSLAGDAVLAVSKPTTDQVSDFSVDPLLTKNIGDATSTLYLAQSFQSGGNEKIYSLDLKLAKHNSPASTVTLFIYSDVAGTPGANISGSGQGLIAGVPADSPAGWENGWTNQIFNPGTILLPNTTYWLVLQVSGSNSSKYWTVVRSVDDTAYASGTAKVGAGLGSLTALNADIAFKINVGGEYPTLSVPYIGGNAYSHVIDGTVIGKEAFYQSLVGTVKANNATEICSMTPTSFCHPNSADQPPQNFPLSSAQIAQMEAQAAASGNIINCTPTCNIPSGSTIGPAKYNGNVLIDAFNGQVYLDGTVWINGNLTVSNGARVELTAGYGLNSGTIIVDNPSAPATSGIVTLNNNSDLRGNYSNCSGTPKVCSAGPKAGQICITDTDCPNKNYIMIISMNADPALTIRSVDVSNNLSAGVIYAPYGLVYVSNNAHLNEVTAQKIHLSENCQIDYETGLASVIFTSGPGATWVYQHGTYQVIK